MENALRNLVDPITSAMPFRGAKSDRYVDLGTF